MIPGSDLFQNALYINNIGRALGQQSFIAPRIPYLPNIEKYFDTVIAGSVAKPETWLRYQPVPAGASLVSGDFTVGTTNPVGALTTYVLSPDLVDAAGKWHVTEDGKVFSFTPILTAEITYKPAPTPDIDTVATATVIPDPFTDTGLGTQFNGLKISFANDTDSDDGYWIYLPPRRPLTSDRKIAQSPDYTGNAVDPTGPDLYFFQGTAFAASTDPHYRYKFPAEIQDVIDLGSPAALPDNFMYLMDTETGTIIDGVAFSVDATAPVYAVKVVGSALDAITTEDPTLVTTQANEAASAYKDRFKLIGAGTSLARACAGLSKLYFNHTHIGADGSLPLSHSKLLDLFNSNSPNWEPSALKGDDHPQYLHRDGMNTGRDTLANGLRGDLFLLQGDNTIGVTADSYRVRFGNTTDKSLHYDQANDALAVTGADIRLATAAKRLEFNDPTVYLDQTRADLFWKALSLAKVYGAATTGSVNNSTTTAATFDITIPTGLQASIAIFSAIGVTNNAAATTISSTVRVNGVAAGATLLHTVPAGELIVLSNLGGSGIVAAGTYTIDVRVTSVGNFTLTDGRLTAVVEPYSV